MIKLKIKLRKVLPRLLALFLILTMMLTPDVVQIFATEPESSTGSTNPNYKGDPGTFEYDNTLTAVFKPAWLVYIQKVDNTCDGVEAFDYSATNVVNPDSQCKRSVVKAMQWNYPEDYRYMDNTLAERSFIVVNKGSAAIDLNKISIYKPDGSGVTGKVKAYDCTGTAPANIAIPCISDDILGSEENLEAFRNSEFTWAQYQAGLEVKYDSNGITLEEAKTKFIKQFKDVGGIANKITKNFTGAATMYPDLIDVIRNANILNILAVISNLCANPSVYDEYIQDFLISQNRDGSSSFYVPVIIAGYVANDNNGNEGHRFYSLPSYYQRAYGFNANDLMELDPDGDGNPERKFGDYVKEPDTYENEVYNYIMSKSGGSKSKYYSLRTGVWWAHAHANSQWISYTGQAYTCMPTDIADMQAGNLGYTYFAFGGAGGKPTDGIGQFQITASSEQKTVTTPGASVAALINIDLKSTGQQLQQYKDTFAQEKAKGYDKADLVINYSFEAVKGNGSSSPLIDQSFAAGATLSGGNKVTIPNLTYDQLKPYLEGSKLIQVADSGIIINDSVTNKYLATVTLKFSDKSYSIYAKGKTVESEYKASDVVSWGYKKDDPNTWHFYSSIGKNNVGLNNFVEIKEGSPGNESFEAMAGVPTTENLYVGFGATEFMMNMDVKHESINTFVLKSNKIINIHDAIIIFVKNKKEAAYMILKEEMNKYLHYCRYQKELDLKTVRAYQTDLEQFIGFMEKRGNALDKENINAYLFYIHSMYKQKTVKRKIASVNA